MYSRRTFHECAHELETVCRSFAEALGRNADAVELAAISRPGIEVLQILTLSVRNEQDALLTTRPTEPVGAYKTGRDVETATELRRTYSPPFSRLPGFDLLNLRQGLNKVAHADPTDTAFFVDSKNHDLILSGHERGVPWVAVVSLERIANVVKALPDTNVSPSPGGA